MKTDKLKVSQQAIHNSTEFWMMYRRGDVWQKLRRECYLNTKELMMAPASNSSKNFLVKAISMLCVKEWLRMLYSKEIRSKARASQAEGLVKIKMKSCESIQDIQKSTE